MTELIVKPMLAESVDKAKLPQLAEDPRFGFQQKVDGHRQMIHVNNGQVFVANRQGKAKANGALPGPVMAFFAAMKGGPYIFDGELVGRTFWLFDLPVASSYVTCEDPYRYRAQVLVRWYHAWGPNEHVRLLRAEWDTLGKLELARDLFANGAEGVMVKDLEGPYVSGKRTKHTRKAKFTWDADCVVVDRARGLNEKGEPKDNFVVAVHPDDYVHTAPCTTYCTDDGDVVRCDGLAEIGEVTALAGDGARITIGDVVCVKYLYVTAEHRLYQPTYPKIRTDKSADECTMDQLRYGNKEVIA